MNTYYAAGIPYSDELWHYGTPRMRWGVRKYQNKDGTLTPAGKERYSKVSDKLNAKSDRLERKLNKVNTKIDKYEARYAKADAKKASYTESRKYFEKETQKETDRNARLKAKGKPIDESQVEWCRALGERRASQISKQETKMNSAKVKLYKYDKRANNILHKIAKMDAKSLKYATMADKGINAKKYNKVEKARQLSAKGTPITAIARRTGLTDSEVRELLSND